MGDAIKTTAILRDTDIGLLPKMTHRISLRLGRGFDASGNRVADSTLGGMIRSLAVITLVGCGAVNFACRDSLQPSPGQQASPESVVDASPARADPRRPGSVPQVSSTPACVPVPDRSKVPRKIRARKPELSATTRAMRTHAGVLVYEITIGVSGKVTDVRLVKPVDRREPWPTLAEAWRTAILDWQYEPTVVDSKPAAVCMTVTVMIHVI